MRTRDFLRELHDMKIEKNRQLWRTSWTVHTWPVLFSPFIKKNIYKKQLNFGNYRISMYVAKVLFIYLLVCFWFSPSLTLGFQETCWFALINHQWQLAVTIGYWPPLFQNHCLLSWSTAVFFFADSNSHPIQPTFIEVGKSLAHRTYVGRGKGKPIRAM